MKKPKIILWDIETSLMKVASFTLYPEYISHENILEDWHIICGSWLELGNKNPQVISTYNEDDKKVAKKLRDVLYNADLIIAHNGDKFDLRKLNTRLIYHGLEPLPPIRSVDTLKEARRIAYFTSNKLDYLGTFLGVGKKIETSKGLWIKALNGNKTAIKEMAKYNKQDVLLLRDIYLKLLPYIKHPIVYDEHSCPNCGSYKLQKRGFQKSRVTQYQRYQCQDCGSWSRDRISNIAIKPNYLSI